MRKSLLAAKLIPAALALTLPQALLAQGDVDQQLGNVHFKMSCNEVAQRRFDRGMRYQHSYWYLHAKEVFEEALKADPTCAMAQWGIALTLLDNPHNPIPQANLAPGLAAIQKAKAIGAQTERERDYIDALMLMYVDYDKLSHRQRIRAFRDAQAKIAAKYPDDDEAQIAYAITLNTSADLNDKTYAQQRKGAAILEPISKRLPRHPGVTHYLIHLYDYPRTRGQRVSMPPTATLRSRRRRRTRSTCRRISIPASAIGRNRSTLTSPPSKRRRRRSRSAIIYTRRITWCMPTCSSAKTRKPAPCWRR